MPLKAKRRELQRTREQEQESHLHMKPQSPFSLVAIAKIQLALARRVQFSQQHQSCQDNGRKESVLQTQVWRLSLQAF